MARVTKCPKCRFTQMSTTGQCKKCGAPLDVQAGRVASSPLPPADPADENPYVPPQAAPGAFGDVGQQAPAGIWRDGKTLVASHDAQFPDRCVKCNQPANGYRLKRKLTWHPQGWYLLIFVNLIVYAVVAAIIQKKSEFHIGLCESHRKRRLLAIGLGLALPLLGGVGCSTRMEDPNAIWLGIIGFIVGMVLLILGTNILAAESIDDRFARVRGANPAFLAAFPPFHR